jgi:hypothetical protein
MKQIVKLMSYTFFVMLLGSCSSGVKSVFQPDFIEAPKVVGTVPVADERINVNISHFNKGRQSVGYEVMAALPSNLRPKFIYKKSYTRFHSEESMIKGHCNNTILYTTTIGDETNEIFGCAGHTSEQHKY